MKITTPNWDNDTWISSDEYVDYTAKFLLDELNIHSASRLLDVGCGRGKICAAVADQAGLSVPMDAVDISDSILDAPETDRVNFHQVDVLKFLNNNREKRYGGVIMKQMFHLLPEEMREEVLIQIKNCLKQGGRAAILAMPTHSNLPMFQKGAAIFEREVFPLDDVLKLGTQCGFNTRISVFEFKVNIAKSDYFDLLKRRFMSNLRTLSDQDILQGIEELDSIYQNENLTFIDKLDVVHLIVD